MSSTLELYHYSGCQNTFIILIDEGFFPEKDTARISCLCQDVDGLLLIQPSTKADVKMVYLNKDGSRASMCGNGLRCLAHLAQKKLFPLKTSLLIETDVGVRAATIFNDIVEVEMGPIVTPKPLLLPLDHSQRELFFLNTGVPHAVIKVDDIKTVDVCTLGRIIRNHPAFSPEGTNVTFVSIDKEKMVDLSVRTYERGVEAETYACGTGAVAAAIVMWNDFPMKSSLQVRCLSQEVLTVRKQDTSLFLKGAVSQL